MESYVRSLVKSLVSVREFKRRREVIRNGVMCRFTEGELELLKRFADRFKISKTAAAELLLREALRDAAEELCLWRSNGAEEPSIKECTS